MLPLLIPFFNVGCLVFQKSLLKPLKTIIDKRDMKK